MIDWPVAKCTLTTLISMLWVNSVLTAYVWRYLDHLVRPDESWIARQSVMNIQGGVAPSLQLASALRVVDLSVVYALITLPNYNKGCIQPRHSNFVDSERDSIGSPVWSMFDPWALPVPQHSTTHTTVVDITVLLCTITTGFSTSPRSPHYCTTPLELLELEALSP